MNRVSLLALSLLVGCAKDTTDGDSSSDSGDVIDTAPAADPVTMKGYFEDGLNGNALKNASICVEEPDIGDDNCYETNNKGILNWTWEEPKKTNFILKFELANYIPTLFTGRYADEIAEVWAEEIAAKGFIELIYSTFTTIGVDQVLGSGGVTRDDTKGHVLLNLITPSGFGVGNIKVQVTDSNGDTAGQVNYFNASMSSIDSSLKGTSASGTTVITNIEPGEHTITLVDDARTCTPWFSWNSDVANSVQVPVQAGTMTRTGLVCQ